MLFCVGAPGAGKSFLLSALCEPASFSTDSQIVPTVGVNIYTLHTAAKGTIDIRELGGALAAVWFSYLTSSTRLIFVADPSDLSTTALLAVKLLECVELLERNSRGQNKVGRLCLVWSKGDRDLTHISSIREVLGLGTIVQTSTLVVTEIQWNVATGGGLSQLEAWVRSSEGERREK